MEYINNLLRSYELNLCKTGRSSMVSFDDLFNIIHLLTKPGICDMITTETTIHQSSDKVVQFYK